MYNYSNSINFKQNVYPNVSTNSAYSSPYANNSAANSAVIPPIYPQYYSPYYPNIPVVNFQANYAPYITPGITYTQLENKTINGKIYNQYQLANGSRVLIHQNLTAQKAQVSTTINLDSSLFANDTEKHIFEHMFAGDKLPLSKDFNNGGQFTSLDDGDDAQSRKIRLNTMCSNGDNISAILNTHANSIYDAQFTESIFDREKQALNIELEVKDKYGYGKREEIDGLNLNRLRVIKNAATKPENIEIMVDGNVNPNELIQQISMTKANIATNSINQLPLNAHLSTVLIDKGKKCTVKLETEVSKPQNFDEVKFQATLESLRLFAMFSDKADLNQQTRTMCYGANIYVNKSENGYTFTYDNETFKDNSKDLKRIYLDNIQKIKNKEFTQQDLDNIKKYVKNAPEYMLSNNLSDNLQKEAIKNAINDLSIDDLNKVADNIEIK